jgi:uncharacterized protein YecE (DUF72 family)
MAGNVFVGTSGFAFDEWKGPYYPPDIRPRDMLAFYSGRLSSVEINYSFRRLPAETTIAAWIRATPDHFTFALKAHRLITHLMRLRQAGLAASTFVDRAGLLGQRLGPILFQCPPNLPYDRPLIEAFLSELPSGIRFAFEFRHPSWTQAQGLLRERGAAWCLADTDDHPTEEDPIEAGTFAYLRLRRTKYSRKELARWAEWISEAHQRGTDVYCFFKHEEAGIGAKRAERLRSLLASVVT